jgi:ATP-binding cassette subfamily B protein
MKKTYYSLRKYKKQMILGPICKMLEVVFELLIPFIMKDIIDNGIIIAKETGDISKILIDGGLILGFVVLGFSSTLVCQYFASVASQGFGTDLRNRMFKKLNELSLREINILGTGYLSNLFNNDVNRLQLAVAMMVRLVIRAPALVIGSIVCSFLINYQVALIYCAVIVVISIFLYLILGTTSKQFIVLQHQNDTLSQIVDDGISGARVVRSFNTQEIEVNKYKNNTSEYYKDAKKTVYLNALINPIIFLVINVSILLTIYFGQNAVNNELIIGVSGVAFSSGDIVALIQYLNQMLVALVVVSNLVVIFNKSFASKKRVDDLLLKESSLKNNPIYKDIKINNGDELFNAKDVDFIYSGKNKTLSDINFNILSGQSVGIIGGTGSGKSTLMRLLDRFYDASNGTIFYKGKDIKEYDLDSLHKEIVLVNQKNQLFKGTIRSNMLIGNPNATEKDMIGALKVAEAYSFVEKYDDFLDHEVEENGANFSGGQRQRLCIARAIVRHSETIIFDDSMSALDFLTDKNVRSNLAKFKDLTKIYVSQRATTLMHCDKIIVVDKGRIESIGTHDELMNKSKVYKEIYESQTRSN